MNDPRAIAACILAALSLTAVSCVQLDSTPPEDPISVKPAEASASEAKESPDSHPRFEKADEWVNRFEGPERDAWQRPTEVLAAMQLEPGMTVADLGAGTGYFIPHLSRAVGETGTVFALDVEPDMVRHMDRRVETEELFNVRPKIVPAGDPLLPTGGVDRVLVVNTWHHIHGREAYAAKLAEALSQKGRVFIVDFTRDSTRGPPPSERIPPEEVIAVLETAGLTAHVVKADLPSQYIVVGSRP